MGSSGIQSSGDDPYWNLWFIAAVLRYTPPPSKGWHLTPAPLCRTHLAQRVRAQPSLLDSDSEFRIVTRNFNDESETSRLPDVTKIYEHSFKFFLGVFFNCGTFEYTHHQTPNEIRVRMALGKMLKLNRFCII